MKTHASNHFRYALRAMMLSLSIFLLSLACKAVSFLPVAMEGTREAIFLQQTSLSETSAAFTQLAYTAFAFTPTLTLTPSPNTSSTVFASTDVSMDETAVAFSQYEFDRYLHTAKILLFEDMSASGQIRYVKEAVDRAGYFYLDVGSAKGWFKNQLLSPVEWDLIIAAVEARRGFGGELFEFIDRRVADGAAMVLEYYDFDSAPIGKSQQFLSRCGVEFHADWYEPDLRVFYWLIPDHPIFHEPNQIPNSLRNAPPIWKGDIGDLLRIKTNASHPIGDAHILAGTNALWKEDHGLLLTCLGGRVIIQTFSSHEYEYQQMVSLWQNYMYQALKGRFLQSHPIVPTPVMTQMPESTSDLIATPSVEGRVSCQGIFSARVVKPASVEKTLFEHNAKGVFLIVTLEVSNQSAFPLYIMDGDYALNGKVNDGEVTLYLDKAATGYLYIDGGSNLYQDVIQPGETWKTQLAFDVPTIEAPWYLVFRPGSELQEQVCQETLFIPVE